MTGADTDRRVVDLDDEQARLDEHIEQMVASWPKPTAELLGWLRRLFTQPSAERASA